MKIFLTLVVSLFMMSPTIDAANTDHEKSVVKIHSSGTIEDQFEPWKRLRVENSIGTGFVINGQRILTNAHVVSPASEIMVESNLLPRKIPAQIEFIAHDVDLAVLKIEEPAFFEAHEAIEFQEEWPNDLEPVTVVGYPLGGEQLSITEGVVSRIEFVFNAYNGTTLLQVDAPINPGNSGGPAFSDDKCIGVSVAGIDGADGIGYLIPAKVVLQTLEDIQDGSYDGRPLLDIEVMSTENSNLRSSLGMKFQDTGIAVTKASKESGLHKWDVISKVGNIQIDDNGNASVEGRRLNWAAAVDHLCTNNDTVTLEIIRNGMRITHEAGLRRNISEDFLFPPNHLKNNQYFVHGPFVLVAASEFHASHVFEADWMTELLVTKNPMVTRFNDRKSFSGEQIVILGVQPYPHAVMRGYNDAYDFWALKSISNVPVRNIAHAHELVKNHQDKFIEFEFWNEQIFRFDTEELSKATEEILEEYSISRAKSNDFQ